MGHIGGVYRNKPPLATMGTRRCNVYVFASLCCIVVFVYHLRISSHNNRPIRHFGPARQPPTQAYNWRDRTERYPVLHFEDLPPQAGGLRKIQHNFGPLQ